MQFNPDKWSKSHKSFAQRYLIHNTTSFLPVLPKDLLEWIKVARPQVDGRERSFLVAPFWVPIYKDTHNFVMIIGGRQIFKSTACTDFIAAEATANPGVQVCYVTHDERNLAAFSRQKLQVGTFRQNETLAKFPRHSFGNVGEISLKNDSTIYCTTDNFEYRHVEGKSLSLCMLDEAQYQDIQHIGKVHQTMMSTKGKLKILGLGGESGSPYEKLWRQTNLMEWIYDDPSWRDKLQFDNNGLIIDEYLKDVLKGRWVPQRPSVTMFQGYHIPQTIFPTIPLTEQDAIEKYKLHPRFSIEYQQKNLPETLFKSHVLGTFFNSPHRPVTKEMVLKCMEPYRYLSLLSHSEVTELKNVFGNQITIGMGVDFGSGSSSVTAIAILVWWRKSDRLHLAFIEKRPQENQLEQAEYITKLFKKYSCDIGAGDLGYGANQVKLIQEGGYSNKNGVFYEGATDEKFLGCRTISDVTKSIQFFDEKFDEHGEQVGRIQIDKTSSIEMLIESIEKQVPHPLFKLDNTKARAKLMIPSKHDYEVDFLLDDLTSITRKDLANLENVTADPRQRPQKEYNHPADSVMAIIYGIVSLKHTQGTEWYWVSA